MLSYSKSKRRMTKNIQNKINYFADRNVCGKSKEEFYEWLLNSTHKDEKLECLENLWNNTHKNANTDTYSKLTHFLTIVDVATKDSKNWKKRVLTAASIAAVVSALVVFTYWLTSNTTVSVPIEYTLNETVTSFSEIEKITLADGTRVTLNSGSSLLYPPEFNGSSRIVYLVGEAYFEVEKDDSKPFLVRSDQQELRVLGTKFNINSYPDISEIKTTLIEGEVSVKYTNNDNVYTLTPGEQIHFSKTAGNITITTVETDDELLWMKGRTKLKDVTVVEILNAMEKKYNVSFQYSSTNLKDDKYNITFRAETDFDAALSILNHLVGPLSYKMTSPNNCQIKFYKP